MREVGPFVTYVLCVEWLAVVHVFVDLCFCGYVDLYVLCVEWLAVVHVFVDLCFCGYVDLYVLCVEWLAVVYASVPGSTITHSHLPQNKVSVCSDKDMST